MGYNFYFYALSAVISFLPIYLAHVKLDSTEIGLLLGIGPLFMIVVPPMWGLLSDKLGKLKEVLLVTLIFSAILGFILFKMTSFLSVAFILCIFYVFFAAVMPLTDSFTFRTASALKLNFGTIRLFGSVGFAISSALLGMILTKYGTGILSGLFLALAVISLLCLLMVKENKEQQNSIKSAGIKMDDFVRLFKSRYICFYFLMVFFVGLSHRMNDSFLSLYIKSVGGSDTTAGLAWFTAAVFEAVVFSLSKYWLKNGRENQLLLFAIVTYIIRWCLLAFTSNPAVIVGMQVLHSLTFAVFYLTMQQHFMKNVPSHIQATGQTVLLSVYFGVTGILGSVIGGPILQNLGGQKLYFSMSFLAFIGLLIQILLMWNSRRILKLRKKAAA
jgi:PPP family 3-phenylpropionic acid transporter